MGKWLTKGFMIFRWCFSTWLLTIQFVAAQTSPIADNVYLLGSSCDKAYFYTNSSGEPTGEEIEHVAEITFTVKNGLLSNFVGETVKSTSTKSDQTLIITTRDHNWYLTLSPPSIRALISPDTTGSFHCLFYHNFWAVNQMVK